MPTRTRRGEDRMMQDQAKPAHGEPDDFVAALRFRRFTPLYDGLIRILLREAELRRAIVERVAPKPKEEIIDLGCGTGSLALQLKASTPEARIAGVDIDPDILQIARRKAEQAEQNIEFFRGDIRQWSDSAGAKPGTFDAVVSSLAFHHLSPKGKREALANALALLRPGGRFILADWGPTRNPLLKIGFFLVRCFDGFGNTAGHAAGILPRLMRGAGFKNVEETGRFATVLGSVSFYSAEK